MDKTIIRTYLQRLAGRAASPRMEVGGWSYRVANHLAPERYEYLTDWQPLTGAEILPAGKTILLATDVTLPDDLSEHTEHLHSGLKRLQGHPYQVVLRELETLRGRPERLKEWARLAIGLAEEYA